MFTSDFDDFVCDGSHIDGESEGFTIEAVIQYDNHAGYPWDDEGADLVTEWTRRAKEPGELTLAVDGRCKRFFNFSAACAKALAEKWGGEGNTPKERAANAARELFETYRDWCADEWKYVGVIVTASKCGVELGEASLWGIEANTKWGNAYLTETAHELAKEAVANAKAKLAELNAA